VSLSPPDLGRGWTYFAPTSRALRECMAGDMARGTSTGGACTQQKRVLGLC